MNKGLALSIIFTFLFFASEARAEDLKLEVPTPCAVIEHNLKIGSNDENTTGDVTSLQSFLQDEGYLSSDPTGYFGQATSRAVKKFQTRYKIASIGVVGPATRRKIQLLTCDQQARVSVVQDTTSTTTLSGFKLFESNLTLKLLPLATINFPNASSTLKMGQTYAITWDTQEDRNVNYTIHLIGGTFGTTDYALGRVSAGQKSFSWTVPSSLTPGKIYRMMIESESGSKSLGQLFDLVPSDENVPVIKMISSTQGSANDKITITGKNFSSRVTLSTIQFLKDGKVIGYLDPSFKNPYAISIDGTQINFSVDPIFAANTQAGTYQLRVANPFGDGFAYSNTVNFTLIK